MRVRRMFIRQLSLFWSLPASRRGGRIFQTVCTARSPVVSPMSDGAEVDVAHIVGSPRQSRRLVLIPQSGTLDQSRTGRSHSESESVEDEDASDDTESLDVEGSVASGEEEPVPPTEPDPVVAVVGGNHAIWAALIWMDEVDLEVEFCRERQCSKQFLIFSRPIPERDDWRWRRRTRAMSIRRFLPRKME